MDTIQLQSPRGKIRYVDSREHFEQGVLRLLGLDQNAFTRWLALAEQELGDDPLELLGHSFRRVGIHTRAETIPTGNVEPGPGGTPGTLWHLALANAKHCGVARSDDGELGWLVRFAQERWVRVVSPPAFDAAAFAAQVRAASGQAWRVERARRQLADLREVAGFHSGRLLEVGAFTGHLEQACAQAGIRHQALGLELVPRMDEAIIQLDAEYDAIVLWDFVGRVPEPAFLVERAVERLRPGGVLAVKTPNVFCPEARMLGPHYYSLRREHLVYFTAASLKELGERAGLRTARLTSISHLLVGFLGARHCAELAAENRGSDLIAYFLKPS